MYRRNIETSLRKALDDTRVVLLHGAGRSALAQRVAAERGGRCFTLDVGGEGGRDRGEGRGERGPGGLTGLRELAQAAGDDFVRGVVLYLGENVLPAGQNLWAVPLSELWAIAGQNRSMDPSSRS